MLLLASALGLLAMFFICALLIRLTVHALPLLVGYLSAAIAYQGGSGLVASIAVGALAAITLLAAAQITLAYSRSDVMRAGVAIAFAVPAGCAGYFAAQGIAALSVSSGALQLLISAMGAALAGGASWMQWSRNRL